MTVSRAGSRQGEERSDEAIRGDWAELFSPIPPDCLAEPVLGRADGKSRELAMAGYGVGRRRAR
jgi:hypothetical protein